MILTIILSVNTFAAAAFADDSSEDITYTEMTLGTEYTATIDEAGGYAYFSFTLSESENYVIYSTGDYYTYAYLYDADMLQLSYSDASDYSLNAKISYYLEANENYYILFGFQDSDTTGSFSVYVYACIYTYEYDDNGYLIYEKYEEGDSYWYTYTYDSDGNITYYGYENNNGDWYTYTYDDDGNYVVTYTEAYVYTYSDGTTSTDSYTTTYVYDTDNNYNLISRSYETSDGYWYTYTYSYDSDENEVYLSYSNSYGDSWTEQYDYYYDGKGDFCSHSFESVMTEPTCTEQGYTTCTCTICGFEYVSDYTDAAGHTEGAAVTENYTAATYTEEGSYDSVVYCMVCGEELSRETVIIPATGSTDSDDAESGDTEDGEAGEDAEGEDTEEDSCSTHTYGDAVSKSTGTYGSTITTYTCTVCGEVVTVNELYGDTRYETASDVVDSVFTTSEYAIVTAGATFPDSLTAASLAGAADAPIILTSDEQAANTVAKLEALGVTNVYIVGGTASVTEETETALAAIEGAEVTRVSGATRYETAQAIAEWSVEQGMSYDGLVVADGENYPDALVASVICGKNGSVMLLANTTVEKSSVLEDVLETNADAISSIYVAGGTSSVTTEVREMIIEAIIG